MLSIYNFSKIGQGIFEKPASLAFIQRPTKRAPDAGDSGAIPSLFLRLNIFPVGRRSAARPSAGNANRWALVINLSQTGNYQKLCFMGDSR